jgi:hypothetical protein
MKNGYAIVALLTSLMIGHSAHAQLMIDQAMGSAIGGATELGSIPKTAMSPDSILYNLQKQGYTNISVITPTTIGTPTQVTATSPAGIPVNLTIDPVTGKVLSALPQ